MFIFIGKIECKMLNRIIICNGMNKKLEVETARFTK